MDQMDKVTAMDNDGQHHDWGGDPLAMYVLEHEPRHGIHSSAAVPTYIPMTCIVIGSWGKRGVLTEVVEGIRQIRILRLSQSGPQLPHMSPS